MNKIAINTIELKQDMQAKVQEHLKDIKDNAAILEYYRKKYRPSVIAEETNEARLHHVSSVDISHRGAAYDR